MTVLHTGSTKKFSAHWGDIFNKAGGDKAPSPKDAQPAKSAKKSKSKAVAKVAQPKVVKSKPAQATAAKKAKSKK
jgi:hypothetical protein